MAYIDRGFIRHNPEAISKAIIELVCEDLKFKDRQNDPEYLYLVQKLRASRGLIPAKTKSVVPRAKKSGKSKFYSKYEKRILSIRESDEKLKSKVSNNSR